MTEYNSSHSIFGLRLLRVIIICFFPCCLYAQTGPITETSAYQASSSPDTRLVIKSNLAAYVYGVANLGVEVPLGNRFSLDIPIYYSPYTISSTYRFRILATQPEFRYWFNSVMKGLFIGLHATSGWYNISSDKQVRYQDCDGDTPAWGAGLSYGFNFAMGKHCGMEFTAGAGYLKLTYDKFHNIENGAKFETRSTSYWGLTKLGVTITYNLMK